LKPDDVNIRFVGLYLYRCSIHPQGWVPIETGLTDPSNSDFFCCMGSIHPQGWVPIETGGNESPPPQLL